MDAEKSIYQLAVEVACRKTVEAIRYRHGMAGTDPYNEVHKFLSTQRDTVIRMLYQTDSLEEATLKAITGPVMKL